MIISASYKTDIPAFYGEWFENRLRAGFCRMVSPYNRNQHYRVSLRPDDVDGFVFWTKNLGPFRRALARVTELQVPFYVQYTINGYPRALESRVVDAHRSIEHARDLAMEHGARCVVWRYDTVAMTSVTDESYHLHSFADLASRLEGVTDEVVVSFMQVYRKTRRHMDEVARVHGLEWWDPSDIGKRQVLGELLSMAGNHGMKLTLCTQPDLVEPELPAAVCIDAQRLSDIGGVAVHAERRGMRPGCACHRSRDIGDYDTCPHGCAYCYAVRDRDRALERYRDHDPTGEYLYPVSPRAGERAQLPLFDE